ncbi:hypothetical protein I4U23_024430 [Adineta vaga]|nr:hypothetical protein I4U23_024430 [Adineta vaga]
MEHDHLCRWMYFLSIISCMLLFSLTESKGFGGGRGGIKGGSRGAGTFSGGSSYSRGSYKAPSQSRSGSSFKSNAMSFAAGAAGGVAAYSLMRSMSGSYRSRSDGYYGPGYGVGETCVNNQDMNGTTFGTFRCPLYGFSQNARHCCGDYGEQFCCQREGNSFYRRSSAHFGWIVLAIAILLLIILLWARRRRQQKDIVMVPTEPPPMNQSSPFYNPPPPPMGYPSPPAGNPYAYPPQNLPGNFNPYAPPPQPFKSY